MSSHHLKIIAIAVLSHVGARGAAAPGEDLYKREVLPVLTEYCYDCHGDGAHKGDLALDKFKSYAELLKDRKFWDGVREHVTTHVMPPEKKPKPTVEQRDLIVRWIDDSVMAVDPGRPDPGHITLRRLNRAEYNNTIRDLFKIESRPADRFPADDAGYGFDNIGDVLSLSPILMEKYLRAAHEIVKQGIWVRPADRIVIERHGGQFFGPAGSSVDRENVRWFHSAAAADTIVEVPLEAKFRITLRLTAQQCGDEKARYELLLDGKPVRSGEVSEEFDPGAPNDHWERFAWDQQLSGGKHKFTLRFVNDFANPDDPDPKRRDRNLALESLVINGPLQFRTVRASPFVAAVFGDEPVAPMIYGLHGEDFDNGEGMNEFSEDSAFMATDGFVRRSVEIPADGRYRLRVKVRPEQAGKESVKLGFKFGGTDLGNREVKGKTREVQYLTLDTTLKKGAQDLQIAFLNDFYDAKSKADRNVGIERVTLEGPLSAQEALADAQWRKILERAGLKLFRRPVEDAERDRLLALVREVLAGGSNTVETIGVVTEAMLCSSKFLFRGGAQPGGPEERGIVPIDEFSLASRLSYFLWSSCPDDELIGLAARGELRKNLDAQVRRMIGDWKARALTENFAGQWLQLRDVGLVGPDQRRFPEFNGRLAFDMKRESEIYFDHILRENRSALEFLDSDYTYLNERLSRYYGIGNVKGNEFRKVSLAGTPRGGILTHGSILTLTSHPTRTSPVKRGKFLLENILGTPPPPPPQNVPPLDEAGRGRQLRGALRQRMEQHRADPTCASCHAFLDPVGFAFEHFDAVGRWRDRDNFEPIDASGQLVTGQKFDGAEALRKLLVDLKKRDFTRSLTENLLVYALGRGLDYNDKPFKDEIIRHAAENGYRFQEVILAVARSIPFQMMRLEDVKNVAEK